MIGLAYDDVAIVIGDVQTFLDACRRSNVSGVIGLLFLLFEDTHIMSIIPRFAELTLAL